MSRSGFYSWSNRLESPRMVKSRINAGLIEDIFLENKRRYGAPRVYQEAKNKGISICLNSVTKIMAEKNLKARTRRKFKIVKIEENNIEQAAPRIFKIEEAENVKVNEVWASDITYIPVNNHFLYLSVVMDLKRRKIIGWSMDDSLSTDGILKATDMAYKREGDIDGIIYHSDQGVQYRSSRFQKYLKEKGALPSMSRRGNCYDNSIVESFFKTLKSELIWITEFESMKSLRNEIFEFIEIWYNRKRLHSSLDYKSPLTYELEINAA